MREERFKELAVRNETRLVLLVMDGLGGLPHPETGLSELATARTRNLDALACRAECGLLDPVYPGITPGSGPGHLALFGYDPLRYEVGRGVLSALGIGFALEPNDVAARCNFATVDREGVLVDRRAGRIPTEECRRLCETIAREVSRLEDIEIFLLPEKEHRACLVLRGPGLASPITDTDPLKEGLRPLEPRPLAPGSEKTARLVVSFLARAARLLAAEPRANMILTRGFDTLKPIPSLGELYGLRPLAIAMYPMYQGLARLVGMDVHPSPQSLEDEVEALRASFKDHDFFFVHAKETDSRGEDGNFEGKVRALEEVDGILPRILELQPDVLAVTGDHSTPSVMAAHSWHPVPVLLFSRYSRRGGATRFDEISCAAGSLGRMPMKTLMPQMLAHALRLKKFGA